MLKALIWPVLTFTFVVLCAAFAFGQMPPGDPKLGNKLGMMELNNSGQDGEVTLFGRNGGKETLVVVSMEGTPHHAEPAEIHTGKSRFCDAISPAAVYPLNSVVNGKSQTLLHVPIMRLLSGRYSVIVSTSAANPRHYVSCGALFL